MNILIVVRFIVELFYMIDLLSRINDSCFSSNIVLPLVIVLKSLSSFL